MRRIFPLSLLVTLTIVLALPPVGQARPLPGDAAVDQYTEAVPSAGGQKTAGGGGTLPPGTAQKLDSLGKDGTAAAATAKATAPAPGDSGGSGPGGMGVALPLILIGALLATITLLIARRRTGRPAD